MKLPDKIKGRHKIRDAHICILWDRDNLNFQEIAEKKNLSERRIRQILMTNHAIIAIDKEWEKKKQIHRANRHIKYSLPSVKDPLEWEEFLHKLIQGDRPLIDASTHNHFISIKHFIEEQAKPNRIIDAVKR